MKSGLLRSGSAFIAAVMIMLSSSPSFASSDYIDSSLSNQGVIKVNYTAPTTSKLKLIIEKEGNKQTYDLSQNKLESFTLGDSSGKYSVRILENVSGNSYKPIYTKEIDAVLSNPDSVYLASTQTINWSNDMEPIKKAAELTKNLKTDAEKVQAIHSYIIKSYTYDFNKAKTVKPGYVPDINSTFKSKNGICYDYSVLFAAMLRSQGIPCKLVKGNTSYFTEYHAWNEVQVDGKWMVIDTTYDSAYAAANKMTAMSKIASDYKKTSEI